jgi:hypothetical protein
MDFGLATARADRVVAGGRSIEVACVRITDAGRRPAGAMTPGDDAHDLN